jgi:hypothetical protein
MSQAAADHRWVYGFGGGGADGDAAMKNLLGGKGANLAEMSSLGLPVPPGFTVTTEACTHFYANGRTYPPGLRISSAPPWRRWRPQPASASAIRPTRCWCPSAPARGRRCPA